MIGDMETEFRMTSHLDGGDARFSPDEMMRGFRELNDR